MIEEERGLEEMPLSEMESLFTRLIDRAIDKHNLAKFVVRQDLNTFKDAVFHRFTTMASQLQGMKKMATHTQSQAFEQIKSQSQTIFEKTQEIETLKAELVAVQMQQLIVTEKANKGFGFGSTQPTSKAQSNKRGAVSSFTSSAMHFRQENSTQPQHPKLYSNNLASQVKMQAQQLIKQNSLGLTGSQSTPSAKQLWSQHQ